MIDPFSQISLWAFLIIYLIAFFIAASSLMAIDFAKIIKTEKSVLATTLYWVMTLVVTYALANLMFDFISVIF